MLRIGIPVVLCIWNTVVVNEADRGVYSTCHGAGAARERVRFHNAAEGMLAREIVVGREELSLLRLGKCLEFGGEIAFHQTGWRDILSQEKGLLANDPSAFGNTEARDEAFPFSWYEYGDKQGDLFTGDLAEAGEFDIWIHRRFQYAWLRMCQYRSEAYI